MESRFEGDTRHLFGLSTMDYRAVGKRNLEWDLKDWKWDGDLFVARQLNPSTSEAVGQQLFPVGSGFPMVGNSSNSSSSCSDDANIETMETERRELEKKRRVVVIDDENLTDDAATLTLKLGGRGYPSSERENYVTNGGKKTKLGGGAPNRAICQVENCGADLSKVKDYHRRHKVCEMHSKAGSAIVGGIIQRFCQQCSRFHVLQEFDEGKRSCRRRLAGHNKRRRKTNPDNGGNGNPLNEEQTSSYLLISLLKILSNMHSNRTDHTGDQDLLSHLLKSLVGHAGEELGRNIVGLLQGGPQGSINVGMSALHSNGQAPQEDLKLVTLPAPEIPQPELRVNGAQSAEAHDNPAKRAKKNDFDLNDIYVDSDDGTEDIERSSPPMNPATSSLDYPSWIQQDSHQSSPPQTSRNSDSASDRSPSSSSADAQSRTGRIVFKLFGKEPNDFPVVLRGQILDWLSQSPTDIESYIRPGCVVLTIYLRQAEAAWEELCSDLGFSFNRLLDISDDPFWTTGWIYVRVQNRLAFAFNGQVVVDSSLPLRVRNNNYSQIFSVRPVAVAAARRAHFTVRGINLGRPGVRLLCAIEGRYLVQEVTHESVDDSDDLKEENEIECVNFSCDMPMTSGRGFMEIEDQGLSSSFFPFIVARDDVCSEIRLLESALEFTGTDAAKQAIDFIHEIGWLLHRCKLKSRFGELDPNADLFPLKRFKWLIEFSMEREWCAVIRQLLDTLFDGAVGSEQGASVDTTLSELCLLHRAVRKNSRPVIEMLLRYVPELNSSGHATTLFRPDAAGPAGLTPLHIAAGKDGSEDVLDALTEDPGLVGIQAWKISRDSTGFTPEDYARLRGHFSYIHLVQRKLKKKTVSEEHVVDIPISQPEDCTTNTTQKQKTAPVTSALEITQSGQASSSLPLHCKLCDHKLANGYGLRRRSLAYRPAMLSMVAIAAVCVCVALLFRGCPKVVYVFQPFRWELLEYGAS